MKILYVTTIGGTMNFFNTFIRQLLDGGHTVHIATNEYGSEVPACYRDWGCTVHPIDTSRSAFSTGNLKAIGQLKALVAQENYDLVHCHTPLAAMCTRLACRKARKTGTKVVYTAHGFHFFKGAPLLNWLLYYPIEKICARFTDVLITINTEDYAFAQKKMGVGRVDYVPGVGIESDKFSKVTVEKEAKRKELGIPEDATLLLSVGELNENKNHETVIRAIAGLDVYYLIAGKGDLQAHLQSVIDELGLNDRVRLLGFRTDVAELYQAVDIFSLPSFREGLNVSVMEAMSAGLPCVIGKIRGNVDLIDAGRGGYLHAPADVQGAALAIEKLASDPALRQQMGAYNREKVKCFGYDVVEQKLNKIYTECIGG